MKGVQHCMMVAEARAMSVVTQLGTVPRISSRVPLSPDWVHRDLVIVCACLCMHLRVCVCVCLDMNVYFLFVYSVHSRLFVLFTSRHHQKPLTFFLSLFPFFLSPVHFFLCFPRGKCQASCRHSSKGTGNASAK